MEENKTDFEENKAPVGEEAVDFSVKQEYNPNNETLFFPRFAAYTADNFGDPVVDFDTAYEFFHRVRSTMGIIGFLRSMGSEDDVDDEDEGPENWTELSIERACEFAGITEELGKKLYEWDKANWEMISKGEIDDDLYMYEWEENEDGSMTLLTLRYSDGRKEFVIPAEKNGKPVTGVGKQHAFFGMYHQGFIHAERIVLPDTVKFIGESAFSHCDELKEIVLPEGLGYIGEYAFAFDMKLDGLVIPDSVTYIGSSAFEWLAVNKIPKCMTVISDGAYSGSMFKEIEIPETVTEISRHAFGWCIFEELVIPASVTKIAEEAFYECGLLKRVTILGSPKIERNAFLGCKKLKTVEFAGKPEIKPNAFFDTPYGTTKADKEEKLRSLLKQVSAIITPETDSFYDWALHTAGDYGGFLRTGWCRNDFILKDRRVPKHKKCLVCFDDKFDENRYWSTENEYNTKLKQTDLGMQFFYSSEKNMEFDIEFSVQNQYKHVYIFDLEAGTYEYKYVPEFYETM